MISKLFSLLTKAHVLFAVTAVFFGVFLVVVVPPFMGIDEAHHYTRAYQLSRGEFSAEKQDRLAGGQIPTNVIRVADISKDIRKKRTTKTYKSLLRQAYTTPVKSNAEFYSFPGSAAYNFVGYLPAVVALFLSNFSDLSVGLSISAARLFMLLSYVAIVAYAIYSLSKTRIKWFVLAIALLPSSLFQAATINADSLILALCLLIFSMIIKAAIIKDLSRTDIIVVSLSALLLPLIKFNYLFISATVLLIPDHLFTKRLGTITTFNTKGRVKAFKFTLLLLALLLSVLWTTSVSWTADSIRAAGIGPAEGLVKDQVEYLVHNPLSVFVTAYNTLFINGAGGSSDYLFNALGGRLGFNNVTMPLFVTFGFLLTVLICAIYARKELLLSKKILGLCSLLGLVVVASIFASLYLSFTKIGLDRILGVQGRYFLPLIPFFMAWLVAVIPMSIRFSHTLSVSYLRTSIWVMLGIVCYYYFMVTYFGI